MGGADKISAGFIALGLSLGLAGGAWATLIDRGVFDGVTLIYDSTQDITWLGDANWAKTSGFHANEWADDLE